MQVMLTDTVLHTGRIQFKVLTALPIRATKDIKQEKTDL